MFLCFTSLAGASEWRFPLYLTYASGFSKVGDLHKDNSNNQSSGFVHYDEGTSWPVGLAFQPYFEFDSGLRLGMGLGPFGAVWGATEDFYMLPVNLTVGFTFLPKSPVSPYVKAGVSYPFANGGYVEGKTPGFLGALGVEFLRDRRVHLGLEIAIDTSTIDFTKYTRTTNRVLSKGTESIRPMDVTGSFFVAF
jgi:hypothetical protein